MLSQAISACRACGSSNVPEVLDLGDFAISDFLDSPAAFVDRAPLVWLRCEECTLVQLRDTVERDRLYRHYWYRSATQPAMVKALQDVVRDAESRISLRENDVVLDIGSNDGTLLRQYPKGIIRYGVEPSATFSDPDDIDLWAQAYWPPLRRLYTSKPRVFTSIACFYDAPDPRAFVQGIAANLADDGIWINQMAYLPATLAANNFGDICHEHLTYWTVWSFAQLVEDCGLYLNDYSFNDVNGGSIRTIVSRTPVSKSEYDAPTVDDLVEFRGRVLSQSFSVFARLEEARYQCRSVVGYGASTKGNTYLQYWNIGPDLLKYIADRNPDKWGKFTPTGQQVISEADMRAMKPDWLLILPFHFVEAFQAREAELLAAGTRFLVPFPQLHVVGGVPSQLTLARPSARI